MCFLSAGSNHAEHPSQQPEHLQITLVPNSTISNVAGARPGRIYELKSSRNQSRIWNLLSDHTTTTQYHIKLMVSSMLYTAIKRHNSPSFAVTVCQFLMKFVRWQ